MSAMVYMTLLLVGIVAADLNSLEWAANLNFGKTLQYEEGSLEAPIVAFTRNPEDQTSVMLDMPDLNQCRYRSNVAYMGKAFYVTFYDDKLDTKEKVQFTWLQARNFCRRRCMESISIETMQKYNDFLVISRTAGIHVPMWTSGRLCDFEECDNVENIEPITIFGWYWSASRKILPPSNSTPPGWTIQPWAPIGVNYVPQPDNAANEHDNTKHETCLALEKAPNETGFHQFHDRRCDSKLSLICEDSEPLIQYIEKKHNTKIGRWP